jgi:two-component system sensor histidine kinase AgrC
VLSAYLMCTPRKWFGTLAAFFFDGSPVVANLVSICVTIPLLYLVIRYIAPYIIRLHYENKKTLLLFFLLPLSYYILEYTLTVYTDLLYTGGPVIIDFMDSFLVLFFFILAMVSLDFSNKKSTAERENLLLTTAAAQA